jgi:hypothetical protein
VELQTSSLAPWIRFAYGSSSSGNIFNVQGVSSRDTTFLGSSNVTLGVFDTILNSVFFGKIAGGFTYDPASAVAIQPSDTTDSALTLCPNPSATDSVSLLQVKNSSATVLAGIKNNGHGWFGASTNNSAVLYLGAGNSTTGQLRFANTTTLPTTPLVGSLEYQSGNLYLTNSSAVRNKIITGLGSSTAGAFWYSDNNGDATATTTSSPLYIVSGVILTTNLTFNAKNGI